MATNGDRLGTPLPQGNALKSIPHLQMIPLRKAGKNKDAIRA